jgi:hypothetical protein
MWNWMEFSNCVNAKIKMNRYNEETVNVFNDPLKTMTDLENYYRQ